MQHFAPKALQQIGEGSYGVAYLQQGATQTIIKRLKAKRLTKRYISKFQQEITFLQQLQHLPVPKVLQQGYIDRAPFYEMTYVNGFTFEQAIFDEQARYTIQDVFFFTKQLLQIVIQLHAHNIVHRDLRIPNILVHEKKLTIIDFGLASAIDQTIDVSAIKNPKKVKHPISDLYEVGHFMLFLLYSSYDNTTKKSKPWQQELDLPLSIHTFIERLLMIEQPFQSAQQAYEQLIEIEIQHKKSA